MSVRDILNALDRCATGLELQADRLAADLDYSAELPAADAECLRQAITLLEPVGRGVALDVKPDPLDTPLPCDVVLCNVTYRKGVTLRALVDDMPPLRRDAVVSSPNRSWCGMVGRYKAVPCCTNNAATCDCGKGKPT